MNIRNPFHETSLLRNLLRDILAITSRALTTTSSLPSTPTSKSLRAFISAQAHGANVDDLKRLTVKLEKLIESTDLYEVLSMKAVKGGEEAERDEEKGGFGFEERGTSPFTLHFSGENSEGDEEDACGAKKCSVKGEVHLQEVVNIQIQNDEQGNSRVKGVEDRQRASPGMISPASHLPTEILTHILDYIPAAYYTATIAACCAVNRRWFYVARQLLWENPKPAALGGFSPQRTCLFFYGAWVGRIYSLCTQRAHEQMSRKPALTHINTDEPHLRTHQKTPIFLQIHVDPSLLVRSLHMNCSASSVYALPHIPHLFPHLTTLSLTGLPSLHHLMLLTGSSDEKNVSTIAQPLRHHPQSLSPAPSPPLPHLRSLRVTHINYPELESPISPFTDPDKSFAYSSRATCALFAGIREWRCETFVDDSAEMVWSATANVGLRVLWVPEGISLVSFGQFLLSCCAPSDETPSSNTTTRVYKVDTTNTAALTSKIGAIYLESAPLLLDATLRLIARTCPLIRTLVLSILGRVSGSRLRWMRTKENALEGVRKLVEVRGCGLVCLRVRVAVDVPGTGGEEGDRGGLGVRLLEEIGERCKKMEYLDLGIISLMEKSPESGDWFIVDERDIDDVGTNNSDIDVLFNLIRRMGRTLQHLGLSLSFLSQRSSSSSSTETIALLNNILSCISQSCPHLAHLRIHIIIQKSPSPQPAPLESDIFTNHGLRDETMQMLQIGCPKLQVIDVKKVDVGPEGKEDEEERASFEKYMRWECCV